MRAEHLTAMLSPSHITRSLSSMSVPVLSPTSGLSSENIKTSQAGWQLFSTISNNMLDASISILEEWRGNDKVVNYRNKYSETPLHEASLYGRKKVASWIIAAGGDINARTKDNWTPLHVAALYNRTSIISLLVAAGANVDSKNDHGETPQDTASSQDSLSSYMEAISDRSVSEAKEMLMDILKLFKVRNIVLPVMQSAYKVRVENVSSQEAILTSSTASLQKASQSTTTLPSSPPSKRRKVITESGVVVNITSSTNWNTTEGGSTPDPSFISITKNPYKVENEFLLREVLILQRQVNYLKRANNGLRDMDTTYFTETSNPLGTFDESLLAIPGIMENIISFV